MQMPKTGKAIKPWSNLEAPSLQTYEHVENSYLVLKMWRLKILTLR